MGASSYIVASDNLGSRFGVLAASALLIGYVVTVAVSVSAGVAAMTSLLPEIYDDRVWISVALVLLIMLGNLRGIRESGTIFMVPTYAYIVVMLGDHRVRRLPGGVRARPALRAAGRVGRRSSRAARRSGSSSSSVRSARAPSRSPASRRSATACPPSSRRSGRTRGRRSRGPRSCSRSSSWASPTSSRRSHIVPGPRRAADGPVHPRHPADGRWVDRGRGPGGDGADPRARGEHELRRLPAPQLVPRAGRLPSAPVRLPRRAAGVHDRHRRPVCGGDRPAHRLPGERLRADPALHARRVHRLHPVSGRHARPLVDAPRGRLARRPRDQRARDGDHGGRCGRRRHEQLLPGRLAGDRARADPDGGPDGDQPPLPRDGPGPGARPHPARPRRWHRSRS